jgi:hypothetical protein
MDIVSADRVAYMHFADRVMTKLMSLAAMNCPLASFCVTLKRDSSSRRLNT